MAEAFHFNCLGINLVQCSLSAFSGTIAFLVLFCFGFLLVCGVGVEKFA